MFYFDGILWGFWLAFALFVAICVIRVSPQRYGLKAHALILGIIFSVVRVGYIWLLFYRSRIHNPPGFFETTPFSLLLFPESHIYAKESPTIPDELLFSLLLIAGSFLLAFILTVTEKGLAFIESKLSSAGKARKSE